MCCRMGLPLRKVTYECGYSCRDGSADHSYKRHGKTTHAQRQTREEAGQERRGRQTWDGGSECNSSLKGQVPQWCVCVYGVCTVCVFVNCRNRCGRRKRAGCNSSYRSAEQCGEWGFWVLPWWSEIHREADTTPPSFLFLSSSVMHTQANIQLQAQQIAWRLRLWAITKENHLFCTESVVCT